jgi:hypothetical protein
LAVENGSAPTSTAAASSCDFASAVIEFARVTRINNRNRLPEEPRRRFDIGLLRTDIWVLGTEQHGDVVGIRTKSWSRPKRLPSSSAVTRL